jgi:serine phosphatase RsbU (regulator of sigma subunit)
LTPARNAGSLAAMSNVLGDTKQQQVLALGRLGWSLRRIEEATAVRRETASAYLKAAMIPVRERGGRPRVWPPKRATTREVSTDPGSKPATTPGVSTDSGSSKPAISGGVSTDSTRPSSPGRAPSASACEPYRELIAQALGRGRNAMAIWQDLVDDHGFTARYASVRRFVLALRGRPPTEARVIITTAPGEEGQVDYGDGPMVRDRSTGKYRRTRLFVLTLGYSRKVFVYTINNQQIVHERRVFDFSGFLLQLAGEVQGVIEGARLYRDTLERARQSHDLKIAAEIQRALLPESRYAGRTFQVAARSLPCRAIGGDFFDYFDLTDSAFGFVLGDVAGKGPPAALLTAVLQGIFAVHAYQTRAPAETLDHVNRSLVRRAIEGRFATTLYGALTGWWFHVLQRRSQPALLVAREIGWLGTGGPIIGMFEDATFEDETLRLEAGDTIVAFSDGITEALNVDGAEFGEERLRSCVEKHRELEPAAILDHVLDTVQRFSAGVPQPDDLTLLVLRYLGH